MSTIRFVAPDGLPALLAFLAQDGRRVLAPAEKPAAKRSVVFEPWQPGKPFTLDKATVPAKEAVLPQCEVLLRFKKTRDAENPGRLALSLDDTPQACPTVVFAARPCDARGYTVLDRPYLQGPFADPYYKARREQLTVFTLTCPRGCNTCFCHWVGGGPTSPEGSDVLMTEIDTGYVLQAITPKGAEILAAAPLEDGAALFARAEEARKAAWASLQPAPNLKSAAQKVAERFTDEEFWQEQTNSCLSCGACTYFCPTCYCFTITDEGEGLSEKGGRRLRSWDTCMSSLFTREASGHNPRVSKALRMRNRVSHKFSTYPENWGAFSCNGCGRCISNCPVCLDIRSIVLAAMADGKTTEK
ncbi:MULTISPECIES: 4Fe-4S dicluster domain-containing protein [unclassified Desulfovibrio]|uniref:4Fe-4S dicluster domain-containing protein n=1 Tax=unclassified Desulfovibrio TaxID=2593640 RepID=UPI000F601D51|nr:MULTISPECIES: 4Fe-4S dicluster domain-containing protein [unclassified Desulfovibrio]RRD72385.1 hydrogenase [Desulfovibrio sp. OH1209_COT-279]RRD88496.1 hydrogenase [Desulfovibrio sp. OH1186_COT-070]